MPTEYTDGDYRVIEHESGAVERLLITSPAELFSAIVEVTAAQALTALEQAGHLTALLDWIATLPLVRQLQFQRIQTFRRDSIFLAEGAAVLGLAPADIDALFTAAKAVEI